MRKRLFIVGASVLQRPAVIRAKELGYRVAVADLNPNAAAVGDADVFYNVSTIDAEGIYEAAKDFAADGIITLATDMPMRSVACACQRLGLPGISPETAIKATDKGEMIKAFDEYNVEHPWYRIARDKTEFLDSLHSITYPCIIKPTDNAGSRGVVMAGDETELAAAYDYSVASSRGGAVIIEEYMTGSEVSVEVIVIDGKPFVLAVTDKMTTGAPHFVEMGHSQPSALGEDNIEKIEELACRAVKAIGIMTGPAHVEIMLTEEGPRLIELGARMGGDCITTHLVPLSTGIDMVEATIRLSCGEEPQLKSNWSKGAAIRYFGVPEGIIHSISGVEAGYAINGVRDIVFVRNIGDAIGNIGSSADRVGYVIAQGKDSFEAVDICNRALNAVTIGVKKRGNS